MRVRRLTVVAATAAAVALPTAALATGSGILTAPARDAVLASPVAVKAQVSGSADGLVPRDHAVVVRLANLSQQPLSDPVPMQCEGGDCTGDSTWGGVTFDPATFAPFGGGSCNGGYVLQVQVDEGNWTGQRVQVAVPGSAPRDVAVVPGSGEATVSWQPAPEPDITGYRVERNSGSGWVGVGETGPDTRSLTDDDAPAGAVDYRVVTLRADGATGGAPVAPCSDQGKDLATPSSVVSTTVGGSPSDGGGTTGPRRPTPSPSPDEELGAGPDDSGPGSDGGASDGDDDAPDAGDSTTDEGQSAAGGDGGEPSPTPEVQRRAGQRVASPAPIESSPGSDVSVPRLSDPGGDQPPVAERYYGEDDEFSETLDFGEREAAPDDGDDELATQTVHVRGALQTVLGHELDLSRIVQPLAGGLLLLTIALHLRRWLREGQPA